MNVFLLRVFGGGLVLLLFCSGCVKTPSPEAALESLRARAAQRLLQEARQEALLGHYQEAAFLLNRVLTSHPSSSLSNEAQWWLARSYQQAGNLQLALENYRSLAQSAKKNAYRAEAKLRVAEIEGILGLSYSEQLVMNGVLVSVDQLQRADALVALVERSSLLGRTTIVLDLGCQNVSPSRSSTNESSERVIGWRRLIKEVVDPLVTQSHQNELSVYVAVTLRCLGRLKQEMDWPENTWSDWVFDPSSGTLQISPFDSLFYQGYQHYLENRLSELAEAKIDGLVFRAQAPLGPYEGFSPIAIRFFEEAFEVSLDPKRLFLPSPNLGSTPGNNPLVRKDPSPDHYAPIFWRWTGWKTRERLMVIKRVRKSLHMQFPNLKFGLELHLASVHSPVTALADYSEDWVEAAQSGFEFIVIKPIGKRGPLLTVRSQKKGVSDSISTTLKTVQKMVEFLQDPRKVWVILPYRMNPAFKGNGQRSQPLDGVDFPMGVGKIYEGIRFP